MEIILATATLLGGIAAIWYFIDRFSSKKVSTNYERLKRRAKMEYSQKNPVKVLIVEDEGRFRLQLKKIFKQYEGIFKVYLAADAGEALDVIKKEISFRVLI